LTQVEAEGIDHAHQYAMWDQNASCQPAHCKSPIAAVVQIRLDATDADIKGAKPKIAEDVNSDDCMKP
jgi:hypothetical protein